MHALLGERLEALSTGSTGRRPWPRTRSSSSAAMPIPRTERSWAGSRRPSPTARCRSSRPTWAGCSARSVPVPPGPWTPSGASGSSPPTRWRASATASTAPATPPRSSSRSPAPARPAAAACAASSRARAAPRTGTPGPSSRAPSRGSRPSTTVRSSASGACPSAPPCVSSFPTRRRARRASAGTSTCAGWSAATHLDFGLWSGIPTSRLVVPTDTHVHRIARRLGLTRRRTADWKAARQITDALARFDPPTRCGSTTPSAGSASWTSASRPRASAAAPSARSRKPARSAAGARASDGVPRRTLRVSTAIPARSGLSA